MRLVDLDPCWVGAGGEGVSDPQGNPVASRQGVGVTFRCPCGRADHGPDSDRIYVSFANPLDGGPPYTSPGEPAWQRTGDSFETLTLTPSILRVLAPCRWHGYVTDGAIVTC
jgi:hypothetical protein